MRPCVESLPSAACACRLSRSNSICRGLGIILYWHRCQSMSQPARHCREEPNPVHARAQRVKEQPLPCTSLQCSLVLLPAGQLGLRARSRPPRTATPPTLLLTKTSWSTRWRCYSRLPRPSPAISIAPACDSAPCSPTQRARHSAARCLSHRCRKRPLQRAGELELTKLLHERLIMALQNPAAR